MIRFANGGILIQHRAELPNFVGAKRAFLDYETSSRDPKKDSLNPWKDCYVSGVAITVDDCPNSYYIDTRIIKDFFAWVPQYLQDLLWQAEEWINHNIKYDMHVGANCLGLQYPKRLRCIDTVTHSKLKDSDRGGARGGYGLDALSKHWLGEDISRYEQRLKAYLGDRNKDYGCIPTDIIGEYGCQDPLTNRKLYNYLLERIPEHCHRVMETEIRVTRELFRLEQNGMPFNEQKMRIAQLTALNEMCILEEELATLVGFQFRPHVNQDCHEVLCGHYGLEPVKYNIEVDDEGNEVDGNASYDKHALAIYSAMPYAPQDVIGRIVKYRKHSQRNSLFFTPILDFGWKNSVLHPTYNQSVRTGRMSCSQPNAQQFDGLTASLIEPLDGDAIISTDASQIEKRLVLHYIQDQAAIAAYKANPDLDSYMITANLCGVSRQVAKAVDLGTGYGEGMKKLIAALKTNPDVVADVKKTVDAMNIADPAERDRIFDELASARGKLIYNSYHATYRSLKPTAKAAEQAVKSPARKLGLANDHRHYYGFITNLYGRDRHLPYAAYRTDYNTKDPYDRAWLAFPTLNQSTAADLMKERWVALMDAIDEAGAPMRAIGIVHDELVFIAPRDFADRQALIDTVGILESPAVHIDVPIRWSIGVSEKNWLEASDKPKDGGKAEMLQYDKSECRYFRR